MAGIVHSSPSTIFLIVDLKFLPDLVLGSEFTNAIYLKDDTGHINDVYGLLDSKTFAKDFKLDLNNYASIADFIIKNNFDINND